MNSINDFVGIPWEQGGTTKHGADCWGLTVLVSREIYGIEIKEFNGSVESGDKLTSMINGEIESDRWHESTLPKPGDVAVMYNKSTKRPDHIGLFIGDGKILHAPDSDANVNIKRSSAIHPVRILKNFFNKIEFYRYDNCI